MIFSEAEFKFPVFDVPAYTGERGVLLAASALVQDHRHVRGACDSSGTGEPVERVRVEHFSQVMHQQQADVQAVRQSLEQENVLIVPGVAHVIVLSNHLEGVNAISTVPGSRRQR